MARYRDSRSPSPAGSRRHRNDDRRSRRGGDDRRRRSRSPDRRYRDRHDRDEYRRRERSIDGRDDDRYRGSRRDRRRSRDRFQDRDRSADRRGQRRDETRRDDDRSRREGTADSRSRRDGSRSRGHGPASAGVSKEPEPAQPIPAQSEVDKKAERLAKLQAWKKKMESKEKKEAESAAGNTRKLLAEMDEKANGISSPRLVTPPTASPSTQAVDAPAPSYTGKFDPKAIAKKSVARAHSPTRLDAIKAPVDKITAPTASSTSASALPSRRGNLSGFGFQNKNAESDKLPAKRKLVLGEEETSQRKLAKLPDLALEDADPAPYTNQEEEDDSDGDNFAGTEEEAAAAARAAHERREERILQQSASVPEPEQAQPEPEPEPVVEPEPNNAVEAMEVDEVDPLDAFMAGLEEPESTKQQAFENTNFASTKVSAPEIYLSDDDDYDYDANNTDPNAILAIAAKKKKKDIPSVDYTKLDLPTIRKNFWVQPPELSQLTEEEATELRLELDGIKVSGKNVPRPVQKWSQCGLTRQMLDIVDTLGYEKPTSIQMQALPAIMSGRDVVGVAKTGSGKTVAFLLPMFRHIKDQKPLSDKDGPIGLIMAPTRELATQIHRDCKPFLKSLGLRAVCAYGGAPIKDQIAELKRGAEIVVATPGRMIDLLAANQGRVTNLKRATYVVLDEADRMFDMGFEPQVMKIFANMRPDRQTILFSATMPRLIDSLTKKVLKDPVEVTVGGRSVVAPEITQVVEVRDEKSKLTRVLELLGETYAEEDDTRSLIFVERQEKADDLMKELMNRGYPCMSIHGGRDQIDRDAAIKDFKNGVFPVLIATSVAARGLDVKQLKLVVNFDAPNHLEDYVHRAGRTGRAGNKGTAVTFVTEDQENCANGIAKALEQSGQPVPERLNNMRKAFKEKVKSGKAKDTTGFGGKGLERLDKEREAARVRERKLHKAEGEDEEAQEEDKKDEEKGKKATSAVQTAASAVVARETKTEGDAKATGARNAEAKAGANALEKAASAVSDINARLAKAGQLRPGQPIDNKGPDAGAFHATLEINDFPQKARWAVTNRTNVAKILDATGTSITTKGTFYGPGKEPPAGAEPKLYILIEGDTEVVVSNALSELTRLLKEGTIAAADAESRAPVSGRYTVT